MSTYLLYGSCHCCLHCRAPVRVVVIRVVSFLVPCLGIVLCTLYLYCVKVCFALHCAWSDPLALFSTRTVPVLVLYLSWCWPTSCYLSTTRIVLCNLALVPSGVCACCIDCPILTTGCILRDFGSGACHDKALVFLGAGDPRHVWSPEILFGLVITYFILCTFHFIYFVFVSNTVKIKFFAVYFL